MASSVLRWISRKASVRSTVTSSVQRRYVAGSAQRRQIGASSVASLEGILPWLMLPPAVEEGQVEMAAANKFYSLAQNQVISVPKRAAADGPDEDAICLGSSHWWLVYLNRPHTGMFLSDPVSGRNLKLPPLAPVLSRPPEMWTGGCAVEKVILSSSSPDDEDCRAVMIFDNRSKAAFCCPGRSGGWKVMGDSCDYVDLVYSSTHHLLYCLSRRPRGIELEAWDLRDPSSPTRVLMDLTSDNDGDGEDDGDGDCDLDTEMEQRPDNLIWYCSPEMVLVEHCGDLFLVVRLVYERMGADGSYVDPLAEGADRLPYKTVGFNVFKYDADARVWRYLERSFGDGGLALFIGLGHSFALRASDFPDDQLKPNSIYFTDNDVAVRIGRGEVDYGGHDVGVFDYEGKTFSPCYFPCDRSSIHRIHPPPVWITPTI